VENESTERAIFIGPEDVEFEFERLEEEEEHCAVIVDPGGEKKESVAVPVGMEGPQTSTNPPTSVTAADIRKRVSETAQGSAEAQDALAKMLVENFPEGFAEKQEELTQTGMLVHRITTTDDKPVYLPPRRVPPAMLDVQIKEADKMRETALTRPSRLPYNAPVVMVPKKDGRVRFCVDYRALNAVMVKDVYPLPRIDETIDKLRGAVWFSTLDLCSGYHQVCIHPDDQHKTAFTVAAHHDEFSVMEFRLCNAPATFQRLMDLVLGCLKWSRALVYIDDVIVYSPTEEQHIKDVQEVFAALKRANLGHRISEKGVSPIESNTKAVERVSTPKSIGDLRTFHAEPLTKLLKSESTKAWGDEQTKAFEYLKDMLTKAPILRFPDFSKTFY
jgi:hypothetical protein